MILLSGFLLKIHILQPNHDAPDIVYTYIEPSNIPFWFREEFSQPVPRCYGAWLCQVEVPLVLRILRKMDESGHRFVVPRWCGGEEDVDPCPQAEFGVVRAVFRRILRANICAEDAKAVWKDRHN